MDDTKSHKSLYYDGHPGDEQAVKESWRVETDDEMKDEENGEESEKDDDNEESDDEVQSGTPVLGILPQKRKFSDEKSIDDDCQFRLQVLKALTREDIDNSHNGVVTKQGVTVTLTPWEMADIYLGGYISKDASNGSLGDQTPANYEACITELERDWKADAYDRQKLSETIERVERNQDQIQKMQLAIMEEQKAIMEEQKADIERKKATREKLQAMILEMKESRAEKE